MSLPVFLAAEAARAEVGDSLVLGEDVAGHAVRVRRLSPGEELDLVDGEGARARARIAAASAHELSVEVTAVTRTPPSTPALVLVQALAKGDRDLQAIEQATEIGVDEVVPWAAERSIADWPEKKRDKMATKWENLLRAASLQARRSRFPILHGLVRGTRLLAVLTETDRIFVLHESAGTRLSEAVADVRDGQSGRVVLVVGPEGGISEAELAALSAVGATPVLLGPTILRSSSAGPAGLVMAQCALGRW
ncbi:16S rRNA (uracil1498-N3)-methyltransferase [Brevibacterium sanguinis]|uniref:Ribosomal RNA small subunit methyltransferase E n=2 Tax=Brevibacterium TaxID=1696 RepID=A0A366IHH7_9MICO|nr:MULTISPECIES: 16S rRNA (uracil(1498)-N(3))-methyltransferase [Brevibacterium]RBP63932.1 16S rRNA (uracil1498-N3)-methyltransferase [Brevibacterium sanguinis]RBP70793.1 16S rRNA (uracil1498-N3)-methyltransferase [Brevibacterium celere]